MAVFQVVLGCILLSLSLINWLWVKQLLQQQTASSSSQVKQRVIKEKVLTSLPCLSHPHPLDCLSRFFCWRNARIIMNCHFVSSTCKLISELLYFILITEWWYPGQINVSAVLYATVLDFRKHPLWIMLSLSVTLALGAPARDQGSQAQHGVPAQYKTSLLLGDFLVWRLLSANLQAGWTLWSAQVEKAFSASPTFPQKPSPVQEPASPMPPASQMPLPTGRLFILLCGPWPKAKRDSSNSTELHHKFKCPYKSHCLSCTVKKPSHSPDRPSAWPWRHRTWGLPHPYHSFC